MEDDELEGTGLEKGAASGPRRTGEVEERRRTREELVLQALIAGRNDTEAAAIAGCSVKTVGRHRGDPVFRRRLTDGRAARLSEHAGLFLGDIGQARSTIVEGLTAEAEHVRLRAADLLMKWATSLHQATEVDVEIVELRAQLDQVTAALEALEADGEETR